MEQHLVNWKTYTIFVLASLIVLSAFQNCSSSSHSQRRALILKSNSPAQFVERSFVDQ